MKNWVEFTTLKTQKYCYKTNEFIELNKTEHVPGVGSFANVSFDGRYNLETIIGLSIEYMNRNEIDNYSGFIVHKGDWLKENKVYQYIKK
jgi:hypothetical protein